MKKNPKWSTKYKNHLPDRAFLYISPGGRKDETGRTVPRSLRHFPVYNHLGQISASHAKNAIGRIPQSKAKGLTKAKMKKLQDKARKLYEEAGGIAGVRKELRKPAAPKRRRKAPAVPRAVKPKLRLVANAGLESKVLRKASSRMKETQRKLTPARLNPTKKATKKSMEPVSRIFRLAQTKAKKVYPELGYVKLQVQSDPPIHVSPRSFAHTTRDDAGQIVIRVAPELADEPLKVIRGVILHEFGHALREIRPLKKKHRSYDAIERDADRLAEQLFGTRIFYDARGVEVSGPRAQGTRPRPQGLC